MVSNPIAPTRSQVLPKTVKLTTRAWLLAIIAFEEPNLKRGWQDSASILELKVAINLTCLGTKLQIKV